MIRHTLEDLIRSAIQSAQAAGDLPAFEIPPVEMARPPKPDMGDYSSSMALKLASVAKRAPLQIARSIANHVPAHAAIEKVEAAPPGFVNITLAPAWIAAQVHEINARGAQFGSVNLGNGQRAQVEFVSANPTGPLHIGGARNAAIGDTLARVLEAAGYHVEREYYINDAGSQIRHFGASIYARYAQALGRDEPLPEDGYKGAYLADLAQEILQTQGAQFLELPREDALRALGRLGTDMVIAQVRGTLERMNIRFDNWFSEKSLYDGGLFAQMLEKLKKADLTFEQDGATWFAATKLGLDKDAVLIRSAQVIPNPDERPTYLASDVAYVWNKLAVRHYDRAIYVWGAGHHGDMPRVYAVAQALGLDTSRMTILIYQNVQLTRGGEKVTMSKRGGTFISTDDVLDEVGADAVRFMLVTTSANAPMDFDLELAVKESNENPVYYVQYMHARIAGILRNAAEQGIARADADVNLLQHPSELQLVKQMLKLEEIVELAATKLEPHHLTHYALDLGKAFSAFYDHCPILPPKQTDADLMQARLALAVAAKVALARALDLVGVSAPETM